MSVSSPHLLHLIMGSICEIRIAPEEGALSERAIAVVERSVGAYGLRCALGGERG